MKSTTARFSAVAFIVAMLVPPSNAQVATAVVREGDALPAPFGAHLITTINSTTVNGVDGYAAGISSSDGVTTLSHFYGDPTGAVPPFLLFTETVVGTLTQTSFETTFGMDDNGICAYSPSTNSPSTTGLDACFFNSILVANEDDPIPPLPGKMYRFNSRVDVTDNGKVVWVGGIDDIGTGANEGQGLFMWDNGTVTSLFKTGDPIPGLGAAASTAVDFDFRVSSQGTHQIFVTDDAAATTNDDGVLLIDGSTVPSGSAIIAELRPIPVEDGGLPGGENWDNIDYGGINEAGEYFITGDSDEGAGNFDEHIARDGVIIYREEDFVDGWQLDGSITDAYMNEEGDIACVWAVNPMVGTTDIEAIYLNGKLMVMEGDTVDWDGDGIAEATSVITDITNSAGTVSIGADRKIYFTADVNVNGPILEGVFVIEDPCGSVQKYGPGCIDNNGVRPNMELTGCSSVGGSVQLELTNGQPNALTQLVFGVGKAKASIGAGCYLNLSGVLPVSIFLPLDASGQLIVPAVVPSLVVPVTFTMQSFFADPSSALGFLGTNGLKVTIN